MKSEDAEIRGRIVIQDGKIATPGILHLRGGAEILNCIIDARAVIQYDGTDGLASVVHGSRVGLWLEEER